MTRRAAAPLAALALAASGAAVSPAHAIDPWIGLEAFENEGIAVPSWRLTNPVIDRTAVAADLPVPTTVSFVLIGKVMSKASLPGGVQRWTIGTTGNKKTFYVKSGETNVRGTFVRGSRVKVLAVRSVTPGPLLAEKISKKSGTDSALEVETAYLFCGALKSAPTAAVWTVAYDGTARGTMNVDVSGEDVVDPEFTPVQDADVCVEFTDEVHVE